MPLLKNDTYTTDYIYALPEGERAELVDGVIYNMAPPTTTHQRLSTKLSSKINTYIEEKQGSCEVFAAPFAVFLNNDNKTYIEPDISVICDKNKLDERGCNGAPDWIIEIISPSTKRVDYGIKLFKYRTAGVREYWIVNPFTNMVNVYDLKNDALTDLYDFDTDIPVCIYDDFSINIGKLLK